MILMRNAARIFYAAKRKFTIEAFIVYNIL